MPVIMKMLRAPNLLIIALTFLILRYLVFIPIYEANSLQPAMGNFNFMLMVIATMVIAASGYISNDYYDVLSDSINKPHKQHIGNQISPGKALSIAIIFSIISIILSVVLSVNLKSWYPGLLLGFALLVTWWYAAQLKRTFLWGNIAVACMSSATIAMAWILENQGSNSPKEISSRITMIIAAVSVFAFLISLLREIIKDMEDIEGDRMIQCKSMPIIKGIQFTKRILISIIAIIFVFLMITQFFLLEFSLIIALIWLFVAVEIPLIYLVKLLVKAEKKSDFHRLSTLLKLMMVSGISSIIAGQF